MLGYQHIKFNFILIICSIVSLPSLILAKECQHFFNDFGYKADAIQNPQDVLTLLSPKDFPMDTIFYRPNGTPKILPKPFIWKIKDPSNKVVGGIIGTLHSYVTLEMFSPRFLSILQQAGHIMLEHQVNESFNRTLSYHTRSTSGLSLFAELSYDERVKLLEDLEEYLNIKNNMSFMHPVFSQDSHLDIKNVSAFGFANILETLTYIYSFHNPAAHLELDHQIETYGLNLGAKVSYLETTKDYLAEFISAHSTQEIKSLLRLNTNIFEFYYFKTRKLLEAYYLGDIEDIASSTDDIPLIERQMMLTKRNKRWVNKITTQLNKNPYTLIVAGVAHFAGPENVLELLQAEGFIIERHEDLNKPF